MPVLSFRLKLLLAMVLLVAGISGGTLYVTHQHVRRTYQTLLRQQFAMEINAFVTRRQDRLGALEDKCATLAKSVRLRATLDENDPDPKDIYDNLGNELSLAGFADTFAAGHQGIAGGASRRSDEIFARVVNAQGVVVHPPQAQATAALQAARAQLERQLAFLRHTPPDFGKQQIGYLAPATDTRAPQLHEIVVTQITDSSTQEPRGALLIGIPFRDFRRQPSKAALTIQGGILVEGQLYCESIAPALIRKLTPLLQAETQPKNSPEQDDNGRERDVEVALEGAPYRLFLWHLNRGSPFPPAWQVGLFSMEPYLKQVATLRLRIVGFGAVGLGVALVLALGLAHGLSIPLRELVAATVEIKRGNFTAKVPRRSRDEIGQLAVSFNEMADGLALKEKYHNVLNMVADKDVAEQLMRGDVQLGGELREVSVLFCDIRGFTTLTQGMPPEQVITLLNEHMETLTRVVYEHQGVVDKFVGDMLMAVFGAPKSYGYDSLRAARCALRMIEERGRMNERGPYRIQIGIGLASGRVVAGCMGASSRVDYTVLGERVNLAARLCAQAEPGQVIVDETTRGQLRDTALVKELVPRKLKGYDAPVVCFALIGLNPEQFF